MAPYCDVIMVNIYPFYGGVSISNNQAIDNLINAYRDIFIPKVSRQTDRYWRNRLAQRTLKPTQQSSGAKFSERGNLY